MLAVHTFTTRPWNIHECISHYAAAGITGISIWRETVEHHDLAEVRRHLGDSGLAPLSLVRGGFFTATSQAARDQALDSNRSAIAEAHALGLPSLVLVCGATPHQTPRQNYGQILDAIATLAPEAQAAGIRLLVEPLHPMYAGDRSAIASLKAANDLCQELSHPAVGIALDVYHVWWDLDLSEQIARCAAGGWLDAYHICDFRPELEDPLLDRGLMGEGCINLSHIDSLMLANGWSRHREVEIFSRRWWSIDQHLFLSKIIQAHAEIYRPEP